jgi:superfamily II DNA/RNA helicase
MKFSDFALRPEIQQAVAEAGYGDPTPIQEQAIPVILTGADLLGIAQTGTGKTAAFVLPMIERMASGRARARMPRSLILSPTRELAQQTASRFEVYGKYLNLQMALLIGGVGMDEQWRQLERGVDVLIATPGRLLDQFERGKVLLTGVTTVVIDEADRMLDMGFIPDVERIVGLLGRQRQTLMFSATMPAEIRRLASAFLSNPVEVQAAPPATTAAGVDHHVTRVAPRQKFATLRRLIETQDVGKALIFCNRKKEVASLRRQLERAGLNARDIHGDLDQSARTQTLAAFKRGEVDYLVATDVAARGLDITTLPCVINYDIPHHADDYVHRIGRTGRAGREGRAFTLVLPDEERFVDAITRLTGVIIPHLEIPGLEASKANGRSGKGRTAVADEPPAEEAVVARPAAAGRARRGRRTEAAPPAVEEGAARERDRTSSRSETAPPAPPERNETMQPARPEHGEARRPRREDGRRVSQDEARRPSRDQAGRPSRDEARRPSRPAPSDRPVVGLGDHVPLFLRRPVPAAALAGKETED